MDNTRGFSPATAIVTGSDSGIGRATAVALAQAGLDLGVTWHTDQRGAEDTAAEVRRTGRAAVARQLDTTDLRGAAGVIDSLAEELGGVDIFVNDAGTGENTKFLNLDIQTWRDTLDTDLNGAFVCLQAAARRSRRAGAGALLR